jgi:phage shock protein A
MKNVKKTPEKKLARMQKREDALVSKGSKAVDEGKDKKANRVLGRAAKVEDRKIKLSSMQEYRASKKK